MMSWAPTRRTRLCLGMSGGQAQGIEDKMASFRDVKFSSTRGKIGDEELTTRGDSIIASYFWCVKCGIETHDYYSGIGQGNIRFGK